MMRSVTHAATFLHLDAVSECTLDDWAARLSAQSALAQRVRSACTKGGKRRSQYLGSRMLLLSMLEQLAIAPSSLREGAVGPYLSSLPNVSLSVSHSFSAVAVAISQSGPIGIDVEKLRRRRYLSIAEQYFPAGQARVLASLPDGHQRRDHFYRVWTLKEALGKARGLGFAQIVSLDPFCDDFGGFSRETLFQDEYCISVVHRSPGPLPVRLFNVEENHLVHTE